ncbi:four-carbon acid sugar kinase family protein [Brevibacillus sp. B_LB10_24]|uniref:four-carbon acid sugar kinase family protein n=1 Tax=Brevibacillus sp. B_LB10_24 TaxID=3380645 RepID=UPI0038BB3895
MDKLTELVIIADDLTGANDTGAQFAKQGYRTMTLLDAKHTEDHHQLDVCVINAETRSLEPEMAYRKIGEIRNLLQLEKTPYVYKKIDSTMRGNIGSEIDALLEHEDFQLAVVAPAYPQNERIVVGGYLLVKQKLLEDSEISADPKSPVRLSHLPALIGSQSKKKVGHINISALRGKGDALREQLAKQISEGKRIVVFDTVTQNDFEIMIDAVSASELRVLWVGSAGLAQSLSGRFARETKNGLDRTVVVKEPSKSIMVIAGSVSGVTRQQIETLGEQEDCQIITAEPLGLLKNETYESEMNSLIKRMTEVLDQGNIPVLTTDTSDSSKNAIEEWLAEQKRDAFYAASHIADCLGRIGKEVIANRKLGGLVLTGGDIAYRTCEHMRVKALRILDEVEEGIPFTQVVDGEFRDLLMITKAGAFGNRLSLVRAVEKMKSYIKKAGLETVQ